MVACHFNLCHNVYFMEEIFKIIAENIGCYKWILQLQIMGQEI